MRLEDQSLRAIGAALACVVAVFALMIANAISERGARTTAEAIGAALHDAATEGRE